MGSVLVINPSNIGLAKRLAYEGAVVRVFTPSGDFNGDNPRRIGSLRMLDQYDFALIGDLAEGKNPEGCKYLGSGSFHGNLTCDMKYLTAVINNLCEAIPLTDDAPVIGEGGELIISTWFDGEEFVYTGYYIDYERMSEGDRGPIMDSMGYVLWKASPADEVLRSFIGLRKLLKDLDYAGPLTIGIVLTEDKIYMGQIRACFDHRHLLWHELVPKGLYQMFLSLSVEAEPTHLLDDYAIGVRCITLADQKGYRPNFKVDSGAEKHFYHDIATARGDSIQEARRRVYRTLKNVCAEDKEIMFRSDIGSGVEGKIGTLKRWGWLHS